MGKPYRQKHQRRGSGSMPASKRSRVEGEEGGEAASGGAAERRAAWMADMYSRSDKFDTYYAAQRIVPAEEYEEFIATLLKPLPVTFRVNPLDASAPAILHKLRTEYAEPIALSDGAVLEQPRNLPWYPRGLGWHVSLGRGDLRKHATLKELHAWLVMLNANGSITRQEAVSMVPPLLLQVEPHHFVLDMCASPGSKTTQLLEALHASEIQPETMSKLTSGDGADMRTVTEALMQSPGADGAPLPTGFVIANDNDAKRAYMLVHQCMRVGTQRLLVSWHPAQDFPRILSNKRDAAAASAAGGASYPGVFDRILCDVPCSGDGTARKNADVFRKWSPGSGNGLHPLQVSIAMRGLQLLKVGGYMAYSTCSFNPVENEAVVAELLRRCGGAVELVDISDRLVGLIRSPGLSSWTVFDNTMTAHTSFDDTTKTTPVEGEPAVEGEGEGEGESAAAGFKRFRAKTRLVPSMFPPTAEEASSMHLERCMRLLPHKQDTGGFFIVLIKKTRALSQEATVAKPQRPATAGAGASTEDEASVVAPVETPVEEAEAPEVVEAPVEADAPMDATTSAPAISVAEGETTLTAATSSVSAGAPGGRPAKRPYRDQNITYFAAVEKPTLASLFKFYGIHTAAEATSDAAVAATSSGTADALCQLSERPVFPEHLLMTRSENMRSIVLMSESIASLCIPAAKQLDGSGSVNVLHTGVKTFESGIHTTGNNAQSMMTGAGVSTPYRVCHEGLVHVLPFMTRQIVFASGKECAQIMRFKGQLVQASSYSRRLAAAMEGVDCGSVVVICAPALDGFESCPVAYPHSPYETYAGDASALPPATDALRKFYESTIVHVAAKRGGARPVVPVSAEAGIPPALRVHYVTESVNGVRSLVFKPAFRLYPGSNPLSRIVITLWKGRVKYGLMVPTENGDMYASILKMANYYPAAAPVAAPAAPLEAAAPAPSVDAPAPEAACTAEESVAPSNE